MIALIRFVLARADNGAILRSTWDDQAPTQLVMAPSGQMDGMLEGMVGMKVGGRRAITMPYDRRLRRGGLPRGRPAGAHRRRRDRRPRRHVLATGARLGLRPARQDASTRSRPRSRTRGRVGQLADGDVVDAGLADLSARRRA